MSKNLIYLPPPKKKTKTQSHLTKNQIGITSFLERFSNPYLASKNNPQKSICLIISWLYHFCGWCCFQSFILSIISKSGISANQFYRILTSLNLCDKVLSVHRFVLYNLVSFFFLFEFPSFFYLNKQCLKDF